AVARRSAPGCVGRLRRGTVPAAALQEGAARGELIVRVDVADSLPGGLAIYGARFGRYPVDPTVAFELRQAGVTKAPFGRLPDGRPVDQFTITNIHGLEVRVI